MTHVNQELIDTQSICRVYFKHSSNILMGIFLPTKENTLLHFVKSKNFDKYFQGNDYQKSMVTNLIDPSRITLIESYGSEYTGKIHKTYG